MFIKKLPEQLGFHRYAVNTHPDKFAPEPPLKKSWIRLWYLDTATNEAHVCDCCLKWGISFVV